MAPLSSTERARRARYASRLNRALDRIEELLGEMPHDFDIRRIESLHDVTLIQMLAVILQRPPEFSISDSHIRIAFNIPVSDQFLAEMEAWDLPDNIDLGYHAYNQWMLQENSDRQYERKLSRGAFCKEYLQADMANPRWSWVGIREASLDNPGALFLFAWEHEYNFMSNDTQAITLFPSEIDNESGKRKHPGHRDALDKIRRVSSGELQPYIVWQAAKDETVERPELAGIQAEFVNNCQLKIDTHGNWVALVGNPVEIDELNDPSGSVGR